jgi:hypothetical protein
MSTKNEQELYERVRATLQGWIISARENRLKVADYMGERCGDHCSNACRMCEARSMLREVLVRWPADAKDAEHPVSTDGVREAQAIGMVKTVIGMCADEDKHETISAYLWTIVERLYEIRRAALSSVPAAAPHDVATIAGNRVMRCVVETAIAAEGFSEPARASMIAALEEFVFRFCGSHLDWEDMKAKSATVRAMRDAPAAAPKELSDNFHETLAIAQGDVAPAAAGDAAVEREQIAIDDRQAIEAIGDLCFKAGLSTPDGTVLPMVKQLADAHSRLSELREKIETKAKERRSRAIALRRNADQHAFQDDADVVENRQIADDLDREADELLSLLSGDAPSSKPGEQEQKPKL